MSYQGVTLSVSPQGDGGQLNKRAGIFMTDQVEGVASDEAGLSSLRDGAASASPPKASIPNAGPPAFPSHVSANGVEIWDWAARLGAWGERNRKIANLRDVIKSRARECGSCRFWMCGRDCPREYNQNGRPRGPSMKSPICQKYEMKARDVQMLAERQAELDALVAERESEQ